MKAKTVNPAQREKEETMPRYLVTIRKDVEETDPDAALEQAIKEIVEESQKFPGPTVGIVAEFDVEEIRPAHQTGEKRTA
jgi:hypothetical protein